MFSTFASTFAFALLATRTEEHAREAGWALEVERSRAGQRRPLLEK